MLKIVMNEEPVFLLPCLKKNLSLSSDLIVNCGNHSFLLARHKIIIIEVIGVIEVVDELQRQIESFLILEIAHPFSCHLLTK